MKASGLKMLVTTFNILMGACVRHRDYKGCMAWYRALLDAEAADARPRVDGKVEAEADESRMETGRGIRPTLVTFNILVNAHVRMNQPDAAQAVLVEIAARRLVPDAATLLPLVDYFSRAGDWAAVVRVIEGARQVAEEVPGASFSGKERGRVPMREVVAHNVVMERMRRSGNLKGVLRRFLEVTTGGVDPRATETQEVEYIIEPDVRTYDILIRTLGMMPDVDSAWYWFKDALDRRVIDTRLFNTMMSVYLHAGKVEETKEVYRLIEEYGAVPDEISVTLVLRASLPIEGAMGLGDIAVLNDEGVTLEPTSKDVSGR
ncbi:hypothetical protein BC830DRAFT_1142983 [Chytriomyces sp. MP71]|nr:hypothetical protein BC830DRAFT_1142983 [Chytriomyces sp. MP71]